MVPVLYGTRGGKETMSMKLLVIVAVGLLMALGCVETTSVEAPEEVDAGSSFQVTVNTVVVDTSSDDECGVLAVLVPDVWSVDSVICHGYGYFGPFDNVQPGGGWPDEHYPPSTGYQWWLFQSPDSNLNGDSAETAYANVTITTNDTLGSFQMAFLAGVFCGMGEDHFFEGDPCSCTVEVMPLILQQETWASIKSDY